MASNTTAEGSASSREGSGALDWWMPGVDNKLRIGVFVSVVLAFVAACTAVGYLCFKRRRLLFSSSNEYKAASLNNFPEWIREGSNQGATEGAVRPSQEHSAPVATAHARVPAKESAADAAAGLAAAAAAWNAIEADVKTRQSLGPPAVELPAPQDSFRHGPRARQQSDGMGALAQRLRSEDSMQSLLPAMLPTSSKRQSVNSVCEPAGSIQPPPAGSVSPGQGLFPAGNTLFPGWASLYPAGSSTLSSTVNGVLTGITWGTGVSGPHSSGGVVYGVPVTGHDTQVHGGAADVEQRLRNVLSDACGVSRGAHALAYATPPAAAAAALAPAEPAQYGSHVLGDSPRAMQQQQHAHMWRQPLEESHQPAAFSMTIRNILTGGLAAPQHARPALVVSSNPLSSPGHAAAHSEEISPGSPSMTPRHEVAAAPAAPSQSASSTAGDGSSARFAVELAQRLHMAASPQQSPTPQPAPAAVITTSPAFLYMETGSPAAAASTSSPSMQTPAANGHAPLAYSQQPPQGLPPADASRRVSLPKERPATAEPQASSVAIDSHSPAAQPITPELLAGPGWQKQVLRMEQQQQQQQLQDRNFATDSLPSRRSSSAHTQAASSHDAAAANGDAGMPLKRSAPGFGPSLRSGSGSAGSPNSSPRAGPRVLGSSPFSTLAAQHSPAAAAAHGNLADISAAFAHGVSTPVANGTKHAATADLVAPPTPALGTPLGPLSLNYTPVPAPAPVHVLGLRSKAAYEYSLGDGDISQLSSASTATPSAVGPDQGSYAEAGFTPTGEPVMTANPLFGQTPSGNLDSDTFGSPHAQRGGSASILAIAISSGGGGAGADARGVGVPGSRGVSASTSLGGIAPRDVMANPLYGDTGSLGGSNDMSSVMGTIRRAVVAAGQL